MTPAAKNTIAHPDSSGGRIVTVDGQTLPLVGASVRAEARAGVARVVLEQRFANRFAEPLAVTYLMPLPADGAVSGYAFTIGARRIVGEVDTREAARERYEDALLAGQSAALIEQERTSLFTQEIGNIPPGAEVVAELTIDQKLAWLDEGAWEWRFPTAAMPRYQGAPGRVADAEEVTIDVAGQELAPRMSLSLVIGDALAEGRRPESPSHRVRTTCGGAVELVGEGGAALDRDLVVRWAVAGTTPGLALDVSRPREGTPLAARAYALLTLVPPKSAARMSALARDLCLLIDTSGSMAGEPLAQARRVTMALVDTLGDADTLEMIEFSTRPSRWKKEPVRAGEKARADAKRWLAQLEAGGGTEMRAGLLEALRPLRADSQRQIVLLSDGAIGFEREIVADILATLPQSCQLHTVGIGAAVNRSLTQPAARAGRGVEIILGIGEDPERAAARLVARSHAPLVVDLAVEGPALLEHAPRRLPDLFAGAPALLSLAVDPKGGELVVRGRTSAGAFCERLVVEPVAHGAGDGAVTALFGRELVDDLEMRVCAGEDGDALARAIEKAGLEFQISTRLTSWVAICDEPTVDPRAPSRRVKIPQALPHGLSVDGLGLRGPRFAVAGAAPASMPMVAMPMAPLATRTRGFSTAAFGAGSPRAASEKTAAFEAGRHQKKGASPVALTGRIKKHKGRELIVEIDVDEDSSWTLSADAHVDGIHAAVDLARSSATTRARAGQTLRLVLVLDEELSNSPSAIELGAVTIALA